MSTVLMRLDQVCSVTMGQAPPGDSYNNDGQGLPLIAGAGDFSNGHPAAKKYTKEASKKSRPGDIILGIRASIGEKVLSDGEYGLGRGVAGLRASSQLDDRFLWHWLTVAAPELSAKGRGATFKQVNRRDIGELLIPIPPLEEQRKISEVLDRVDDLRTKRRRALVNLDKLADSVFLDLFVQRSSRDWRTLSLGEVAEVVSGITKGRRTTQSVRPVPYLAVLNVQDKHLQLSTVKHIDATEEEIRRYRLRKDDLLLTEGGDPDKLGRGSLWNEELPEAIHQNHIFRVRITSPDRVHPVYLNWLVSSQWGKNYFLRSAKQTTGIASINKSQLTRFPLVLPPPVAQEDFAIRIASLHRLKAANEKSLSDLDVLFASLLDRAFSARFK
ncbi:restriction endonuclease subunit S [Micromonospora andamanensis]|uniref:Type I restriction modification DNA specificity domain-containing protein n=1 Tax=Micromonospora andamanensis TaxID=1287068 RepID=A0ABQ4HWK1_9ACTN|nr:restriction endonuclease subunit S [Micromonospora andamanensis]GIJ09995.1 hypothetical protein Van01_32090 [Micromonospora andamanensis]